MFKRVIVFLLVPCLLVLFSANVFSEENKGKVEIQRLFPQMKIDSFKWLPEVALYEVVYEEQVFYISPDFKYAIVGNIIDVTTRRNLTEEKLRELKNSRKIEFSSLLLKDAIKISEGTKSIAVFTDPDCPFCKKLHSELKKLKDVAIYVYLYPVVSAKEKSKAIWCSDNKIKALEDAYQGKSKQAGKICENPIERNIQFAKRHNITGVPAVILENGRLLMGFMEAEKISQSLHD